MTSKKDLKKEVDNLTNDSGDRGICFVYSFPDGNGSESDEVVYDKYKEPVDPAECGLLIKHDSRVAPFIVQREKAEAEGWPIVRSIPDKNHDPPRDLVEVSEWCINPWVDNPDEREYYTE